MYFLFTPSFALLSSIALICSSERSGSETESSCSLILDSCVRGKRIEGHARDGNQWHIPATKTYAADTIHERLTFDEVVRMMSPFC